MRGESPFLGKGDTGTDLLAYPATRSVTPLKIRHIRMRSCRSWVTTLTMLSVHGERGEKIGGHCWSHDTRIPHVLRGPGGRSRKYLNEQEGLRVYSINYSLTTVTKVKWLKVPRTFSACFSCCMPCHPIHIKSVFMNSRQNLETSKPYYKAI